jgi:hypothetical protein
MFPTQMIGSSFDLAKTFSYWDLTAFPIKPQKIFIPVEIQTILSKSINLGLNSVYKTHEGNAIICGSNHQAPITINEVEKVLDASESKLGPRGTGLC